MDNIIAPSHTRGRSAVLRGANPAIGEPATYTVPDNTYFELVSVTWGYNNKSTAIRMGLSIRRITDFIAHTVSSGNINAGYWNMCAAAGIGPVLSVHTLAVTMPLPAGILLHPGDVLRVESALIHIDDVLGRLVLYGYPQMRLEN